MLSSSAEPLLTKDQTLSVMFRELPGPAPTLLCVPTIASLGSLVPSIRRLPRAPDDDNERRRQGREGLYSHPP